MIEKPNGTSEEKELPTLKITWDAEKQGVGMEFDGKQFQNWDFVCAVLGMATEHAKLQRQMAIGANLQRQAMEQQQAAQLHQQLRRGGR